MSTISTRQNENIANNIYSVTGLFLKVAFDNSYGESNGEILYVVKSSMRSLDGAFEFCSNFSWLQISSNLSSAKSIFYIASENSTNWFSGQKLLIWRALVVEGGNPIIVAKSLYWASHGVDLDISC